MSIADFFTELEELNLYAQLDPESFPRLVKRALNSDLRHALEISHGVKPIAIYEEWKDKALHLGTQFEAAKRQGTRKPKAKDNHSVERRAGLEDEGRRMREMQQVMAHCQRMPH